MTSYAIFIGINDYDDRAFKALVCPQDDANELCGLFKNVLGYGEFAVRLVQQVTVLEVRRKLKEIGWQIRNGDSFLFFFAGHGYQHPEGHDQYLLFPEADARLIRAGKMDGELLSLSTLIALTDGWEGVQRIFVLDACRSWLPGRSAQSEVFRNEAALAYLASRDPGLRRTRDKGENASPKEALALPPVIINACRDGQEAYEIEHKRRGVLSLAIERQLREEERAGQPIWLGQELLDGVRSHMTALLGEARIGVSQSPYLTPSDARVLLYKPFRSSGARNPSLPDCVDQAPEMANAESPADGDPLQPAAHPAPVPTYQDYEKQMSDGDTEKAIELLRKLVDHGDLSAMQALAYWYSYGGQPLIPKDEKAGYELYRRAAENGNAECMRMVGWAYRAGKQVSADETLWLQWTQRAADAGSMYAMLELCQWSAGLDKAGQPQEGINFELAKQWLNKAITTLLIEDAWGHLWIARLTSLGPPELRDMNQAKEALNAVIESTPRDSNDVNIGLARCRAMAHLAWILEKEQPPSPEKVRQANALLKEAHAQSEGKEPGDSFQMFGSSAQDGLNGIAQDAVNAREFLERASSLGHLEATRQLARNYLYGNHYDHFNWPWPDDEQRAVSLYLDAANAGDPESTVWVACRYAKGLYLPKSLDQAVLWMGKALACSLDAHQLHALAEVYRDGDGALHDPKKAMELLQRCLAIADSQYMFANASRDLAFMLSEGRGAPRDEAAAMQWFEKAVASGEDEARRAAIEYDIGVRYLYGAPYGNSCKECNPRLAQQWIERAASHGHIEAMKKLATHYRGLSSDSPILASEPDAALEFLWSTRVAETGDLDYILTTAHALAMGIGTGKDLVAAEAWLERLEPLAIRQKRTDLFVEIGQFYWEGKAGDGERPKAQRWFAKAQQHGENGVLRTLAKQLASNAPDADGVHARQALVLMEDAASAGDAEAMVDLGFMWLYGVGTSANLARANECFEKYVSSARNLVRKGPDNSSTPVPAGEVRAERLASLGDHYLQRDPPDMDTAKLWLERAVDEGSDQAAYHMAVMHAEPWGQPQDPRLAESFFRRGAQNELRLNRTQGLVRLSRLAMPLSQHLVNRDEFIITDVSRALALRIIADLDPSPPAAPRAMYLLGTIYQEGLARGDHYKEPLRDKPDYHEANFWFQRAAEAGDVEAMIAMADAYKRGHGVAQDPVRSNEWMKRAADAGNVQAMIHLGACTWKGYGAAKDERKAQSWFDQALCTDPGCSLSIAEQLFEEEDPSTHAPAFPLFLKAAEGGDKSVMERVASLYARGLGVSKDEAKADGWLRRRVAKDEGGWHSYTLGEEFLAGKSFPRDPVKAIGWLRMAAEKGNPRAMWMLGEAYAVGEGVPLNEARAEEWFQKAIDAGWGRARFDLAYWWLRWDRKDRFDQARALVEEQLRQTKPDGTALACEVAWLRKENNLQQIKDETSRYWYQDDFKFHIELGEALLELPITRDILYRAFRHLQKAAELMESARNGGSVVSDTELARVKALAQQTGTRKPPGLLARMFGRNT
jgi:TPR repeat protein